MINKNKLIITTFVAAIVAVYAIEMLLILVGLTEGQTQDFASLQGRETENILLSKAALFVHLLAVTGIVCFLYGYFIEPYWIQVRKIVIKTNKLSAAGIRLVQISDTHCDKKLRNEKRLIELVNAAKPDIIAFTGDTLNLNTPSALPLFKDTMRKLNANLAKFAVRGNVDIWHLPDLDFFGATGFEVLDGKTVTLQKNGEQFAVSGLSCEHPSDFAKLLQAVPENRFSIFLYHFSDLVEDLENLNVDLYLSGHTHGGQVALPIYGALTTLSKFGKKYESGMYSVNDTILYVNRGIGMEGGIAPRVRFLARPEITVFDIGPEKNRAH